MARPVVLTLLLAPVLLTGCNVPPPDAARLPGEAGAAAALGVYTVRPGDSLSVIAVRHGVEMAALAQANAVEPPYTIYAGQTLRLPSPRLETAGRPPAAPPLPARRPVDEWRGPVSDVPLAAAAGAPRPVEVASLDPLPSGVEAREARTTASPRRPDPAPRPAAPSGLPGGPIPVTATSAPPEPPPQGARFLWPLDGPVVASFGRKADGRHNDGINVAAPQGTAIQAAADGTVAYAGNELRGYGNLLLLRHTDGWVTAYAHLDEILVEQGDSVVRRQPIATVGSSGAVASPQLHFEIRQGSAAVDPIAHLPPQP